jgi:hypothetical protein
MTADTVPEYTAPSHATFNGSGKKMTVGAWTLSIRGGGASQPSFICA